ncbi:MAG: hypothetical protein H6R46_1221, partial [Proteobacteria bacterium]|nr:hypothetical protein [Pseudomonadota bacterium]
MGMDLAQRGLDDTIEAPLAGRKLPHCPLAF